LFNTLKSRLFFLFGGLILIAAAAGTWLASDLAVNALKKSSGQNLEEVASQLRDKIELDLHERYTDLQVAASFANHSLTIQSTADVSGLLNALHKNFPSYAWIGLMAPDGTVMESTDNLLKGANVSHRPWFQAASERPYLGDAHEALLLAEKLDNPSGTPPRFVDIAVPLKDNEGDLIGVLGAHLHLDWVANIGKSLQAPLQRLKSELLIVDSTGTILIGPEDTVGQSIPDSLFNRATAVESGYLTNFMSIGAGEQAEDYLVGFSRLRDRAEYTSFNWLVLVRKSAVDAFLPSVDLRNTPITVGALIAIVLIVFASAAARWTTRPLLKMADEASQLDPDNPAQLIQLRDDYEEVRTLSSVLRDLIQRLADKTHQMNELNTNLEHRVAERTQALEQANRQLEKTVRTDALTGLNNRRYFFELGKTALKKSVRSGTPLAVIMFDADHFKKVNDSHGHAVGDKALMHLSRLAHDSIRDIDVLARVGGEEFAVLLENTSEDAAADVAERLRASIESSPLPLERGEIVLMVSVGVSSFFPDSSDDLDDLMARADKALYAAKTSGRNRVCCYSKLKAKGASPGDEVAG